MAGNPLSAASMGARQDSLTISIPAPAERHDAILREAIAPLGNAIRRDPRCGGLYFERLNKPDWRLGVRIFGEQDWLARDLRGTIDAHLAPLRERGEIAELVYRNGEADDKWVGGGPEMKFLAPIYDADTGRCFALLEAEARGLFQRSRAEISFDLVERILDRFGFEGNERIEFHRRGYQWAVDLGRWDADVFTALEEKYQAQRESLRRVLAGGRAASAVSAVSAASPADDDPIIRDWVRALSAPIEALLEAHASGALQKDLLTVAGFIAHGHSNRLGINATQEAVIRYLVWRTLTEETR